MENFFVKTLLVAVIIISSTGRVLSLECYYCWPCEGSTLKKFTCSANAIGCSYLRGLNEYGDINTGRRCEANSSLTQNATMGNCYHIDSYETYTNATACICNTNFCNLDVFTTTTTTTTTTTKIPNGGLSKHLPNVPALVMFQWISVTAYFLRVNFF